MILHDELNSHGEGDAACENPVMSSGLSQPGLRHYTLITETLYYKPGTCQVALWELYDIGFLKLDPFIRHLKSEYVSLCSQTPASPPTLWKCNNTMLEIFTCQHNNMRTYSTLLIIFTVKYQSIY